MFVDGIFSKKLQQTCSCNTVASLICVYKDSTVVFTEANPTLIHFMSIFKSMLSSILKHYRVTKLQQGK